MVGGAVSHPVKATEKIIVVINEKTELVFFIFGVLRVSGSFLVSATRCCLMETLTCVSSGLPWEWLGTVLPPVLLKGLNSPTGHADFGSAASQIWRFDAKVAAKISMELLLSIWTLNDSTFAKCVCRKRFFSAMQKLEF